MGWGDCGTDSQGRGIGYLFAATCDEPGCDKQIDRGLSYACGEMHGEDEVSCEKYFCERHRGTSVCLQDGRYINICRTCAVADLASGYWTEDDDGDLRPRENTK